jgi:hypothetical protein
MAFAKGIDVARLLCQMKEVPLEPHLRAPELSDEASQEIG